MEMYDKMFPFKIRQAHLWSLDHICAFVYDNIVTRFPWDQRTNPFIATVKVALIWLIDTDIMVAFTSRHL